MRLVAASERLYAVAEEDAVDQSAQVPGEHHIPLPGEASIPEIEDDETIAPRPEELIADIARAEPDTTDHHADPRGAASGA